MRPGEKTYQTEIAPLPPTQNTKWLLGRRKKKDRRPPTSGVSPRHSDTIEDRLKSKGICVGISGDAVPTGEVGLKQRKRPGT